jgi:hypothetical protein
VPLCPRAINDAFPRLSLQSSCEGVSPTWSGDVGAGLIHSRTSTGTFLIFCAAGGLVTTVSHPALMRRYMRQDLAHLCRLARCTKVVSLSAVLRTCRSNARHRFLTWPVIRPASNASARPLLFCPCRYSITSSGRVIRIPPAHFRPLRRRTCTQYEPPLGLAWRSTLVVQHSKIRLASNRDCGVFLGAVFMRVFGTDVLGPVAGYAPIGFGRRPSRCEGAFVLDRELEL